MHCFNCGFALLPSQLQCPHCGQHQSTSTQLVAQQQQPALPNSDPTSELLSTNTRRFKLSTYPIPQRPTLPATSIAQTGQGPLLRQPHGTHTSRDVSMPSIPPSLPSRAQFAPLRAPMMTLPSLPSIPAIKTPKSPLRSQSSFYDALPPLLAPDVPAFPAAPITDTSQVSMPSLAMRTFQTCEQASFTMPEQMVTHPSPGSPAYPAAHVDPVTVPVTPSALEQGSVNMSLVQPPTRTPYPLQLHKNKKHRRLKTSLGLLTACVVLTICTYLFVNFALSSQTQIQATVRPTVVANLPPLTISDPAKLYTAALSRRPLLSDPLAAIDANNWTSANTEGTCTYDHTMLHAVSNQRNQMAICLAQAQKFSNIAYQATIHGYQGTLGGLIIRSDDKGQLLYLFGISPNNRYLLATSRPNDAESPRVIGGGISNAIKGASQSNTLTIIAQQTTLYLYINGSYLMQINDTTASSGYIGLFVGDSNNDTADAHFSNVKVWGI